MQKYTKKVLNICMIITIIVVIVFIALILVLQYSENGETNMPFEISKITIISTADGQNMQDESNMWNLLVSQNNDIYIDIKKNDDYDKSRIIEKIIINNFKIEKEPQKGKIKIYKPSKNELATFENKEEYVSSEIVFLGAQSTDLQELQISNQGGRLAFRCSNENIGTYISNEDNELNYSQLLKKINVNDDDLSANISFDIEILLTNGKAFKSNLKIDIPVGNVVENGKSSKEITELDIVFKRVEN